jgi:hypothetical protein
VNHGIFTGFERPFLLSAFGIEGVEVAVPAADVNRVVDHLGLPDPISIATRAPTEETKYKVLPTTAGEDAMGMLDLKFHFSLPVDSLMA